MVAYYNRACCRLSIGDKENCTSDLKKAKELLKVHADEVNTTLQCVRIGGRKRESDVLPKQMEVRMEVLNYFGQKIDETVKKIDEEKSVEPVTTSILEFIPDADLLTTEELYGLHHLGFEFAFTVKKKASFSWGGLFVFLLGAIETVAGALVLTLSAGSLTSVGMGLISEGVSDCIDGITGMVQGDFDWTSWGASKAVSIALSVATGGVGRYIGSALKHGAKAGITAAKQTKGIQTIAKVAATVTDKSKAVVTKGGSALRQGVKAGVATVTETKAFKVAANVTGKVTEKGTKAFKVAANVTGRVTEKGKDKIIKGVSALEQGAKAGTTAAKETRVGKMTGRLMKKTKLGIDKSLGGSAMRKHLCDVGKAVVKTIAVEGGMWILSKLEEMAIEKIMKEIGKTFAKHIQPSILESFESHKYSLCVVASHMCDTKLPSDCVSSDKMDATLRKEAMEFFEIVSSEAVNSFVKRESNFDKVVEIMLGTLPHISRNVKGKSKLPVNLLEGAFASKAVTEAVTQCKTLADKFQPKLCEVCVDYYKKVYGIDITEISTSNAHDGVYHQVEEQAVNGRTLRHEAETAVKEVNAASKSTTTDSKLSRRAEAKGKYAISTVESGPNADESSNPRVFVSDITIIDDANTPLDSGRQGQQDTELVTRTPESGDCQLEDNKLHTSDIKHVTKEVEGSDTELECVQNLKKELSSHIEDILGEAVAQILLQKLRWVINNQLSRAVNMKVQDKLNDVLNIKGTVQKIQEHQNAKYIRSMPTVHTPERAIDLQVVKSQAENVLSHQTQGDLSHLTVFSSVTGHRVTIINSDGGKICSFSPSGRNTKEITLVYTTPDKKRNTPGHYDVLIKGEVVKVDSGRTKSDCMFEALAHGLADSGGSDAIRTTGNFNDAIAVRKAISKEISDNPQKWHEHFKRKEAMEQTKHGESLLLRGAGKFSDNKGTKKANPKLSRSTVLKKPQGKKSTRSQKSAGNSSRNKKVQGPAKANQKKSTSPSSKKPQGSGKRSTKLQKSSLQKKRGTWKVRRTPLKAHRVCVPRLLTKTDRNRILQTGKCKAKPHGHDSSSVVIANSTNIATKEGIMNLSGRYSTGTCKVHDKCKRTCAEHHILNDIRKKQREEGDISGISFMWKSSHSPCTNCRKEISSFFKNDCKDMKEKHLIVTAATLYDGKQEKSKNRFTAVASWINDLRQNNVDVYLKPLNTAQLLHGYIQENQHNPSIVNRLLERIAKWAGSMTSKKWLGINVSKLMKDYVDWDKVKQNAEGRYTRVVGDIQRVRTSTGAI